jgi:hypothetical protein
MLFFLHILFRNTRIIVSISYLKTHKNWIIFTKNLSKIDKIEKKSLPQLKNLKVLNLFREEVDVGRSGEHIIPESIYPFLKNFF